MPLQAEFRPRFKKDLKALPRKDQADVNDAVNTFLQRTEKVDVVRLDAELWRLKVGPWRVFFTFSGDRVIFLTVERRGSKTYG